MTYQEKLKDPRWQKKRLQILDRDEWCCQKCYDTESTLQIHHRYYKKCDPWEYPNEALITLCGDCHLEEKELRPAYESDLLKILKRNFLAEDVNTLTKGFYAMPIIHASDIVASVYEWALSDEKIQRELIDRYFEHLRENRLNATT